MLGELNSSHSGASGGVSPPSQASNNGRLGLFFDRNEYEGSGRLKVTSVIPLGPAAISKQVKAGDYVLAVNGVNVGATTNLEEQLMHQVGRRVELRVAASPDGADAKTVVVQPITGGAERTLLYRDWIESNRAYVEKISNGKLGYVHIRDMSDVALRQLALDLDADNRAKAGVVIDVRHNNGGFVNVYAIDVLARRGYLDDDASRPAGVAGAHIAGPALARAADDSRDESAFALGCGGLHRGIPVAQARQGGGRTHRRLDHLHRQRDAHRRHVHSHARHAHHVERRQDDGAEPAPGGRAGYAPDR